MEPRKPAMLPVRQAAASGVASGSSVRDTRATPTRAPLGGDAWTGADVLGGLGRVGNWGGRWADGCDGAARQLGTPSAMVCTGCQCHP